jgi:hypothetical protein
LVAMARPMPGPAPVTMAILRSSFPMVLLRLVTAGPRTGR